MIILDTSTDPEVLAYEQYIDIDQRTYLFKFDWNEREEFWFFSMLDHDEDPIVLGRKVVIGIDLLLGVTDARKPAGLLIAADSTGRHQEMGLGTTSVLISWLDQAELDELEAEAA